MILFKVMSCSLSFLFLLLTFFLSFFILSFTSILFFFHFPYFVLFSVSFFLSFFLSFPLISLYTLVPQAVVFISPGCNYFCLSLILLTFQLRDSSIRINPNRKKSHFTTPSYSSACCLQFQSN